MPNPFPGPIDFDLFPWQREILNIDHGYVTVKKAAQIGFSVAGIVRALYVVSELQNDTLYVLPTAGLAGNFSKARIDTIVENSPELDELFKTNNSASLKKTKANVNMHIVGSVSSRALVSNPVSTAIIDEYDRCAENTFDLVSERLSGQITKYLFSLSTPTLPEFGIDKQHANGTQEEFHFKCPSCNRLELLTFPDNIVLCGDHPGDERCHDSYLICSQCEATLPHEGKRDWLKTGVWVPQVKVHGHRSFHINQLYSSTVTPGEIAVAYHKSQLSELAAIEFKNQKLGEPHISEGARLTDKLIYERFDKSRRIGQDRPEDATRMICAGVDVGTYLDVWIAEYEYDRDPGRSPYENSIAKVLQVIRLPGDDWNALSNLMREWQIRHCVVDFQPDTVNARRFCKMFGGYASMCQYRRGTVGNEIKVTEDEWRVPNLTVDRTVFLDMALGRFHKGRVIVPGGFPSVAVEHLKAPIRTYELDELGLPKAVYKSIADDHFAHAAAYCEIAHFRAFSHSTGRTIRPGEAI